MHEEEEKNLTPFVRRSQRGHFRKNGDEPLLCCLNRTAIRRSGGIAPPFLTPALDGGEWLASHHSRFTLRYPLDRRQGGSPPQMNFASMWCTHCARITQSVRLVPGWTAEVRSSSPGNGKLFHLFTSSRAPLEPTQPPIQWVAGARSPGVKRPGRETDHSPPSRAKIKNGGVIPSLLHTSSGRSA
jgi:hypothetical protein